MTGLISDQAPPGPDYLIRRITDLERQIRELVAGRRLEAASIGAGGITITGGSIRILDDNGDLVVQIGKLADGTYGLAAVNGAGAAVKLSALAFGPAAATVSADAFITSTTFADASPPGPVLTNVVIGDTGRCIIMLSAAADVADEACFMGVEIDGPTPFPADQAWSYRISNRNLTQSIGLGASKVLLAEGLEPGTYTFRAKYRVVDGNSVNIYDRTLIVLPF